MRLWRAEVLYLALIAVLLVLAVWWFPGGGSITTDSYSTSFDGRKALFHILQRLDEDVSRSTEQLIPQPGAEDRLLFLGPARYPTLREWDELRDEVMDGATLIFAASTTVPDLKMSQLLGVEVKELVDTRAGDEDDEEEERRKKQGDVGVTKEMVEKSPGSPTRPPGQKEPESELLPRTVPGKSIIDGIDLPKYEVESSLVPGKVTWYTTAQLNLDSAAGWEVLLSANGAPQVARRNVGNGTMVFVASDEVFSNESMIDPQQALLAYRIIESCPASGVTWIDETLNSSGVPKMLGLLFDPLFRPLTLQGALLLALFGWWGSRRFGPPQPLRRFRRRSIVEHAEALGSLYYRAGAGGWAVQSMHSWLLLELRRLCGGGFKVDDAQAIARQTQLDPAKVEKLLRQVERADEQDPSPQEAGKMLWNMSRILARVRKEI